MRIGGREMSWLPKSQVTILSPSSTVLWLEPQQTFHMGAGDLNSDLHSCTAVLLPSKSGPFLCLKIHCLSFSLSLSPLSHVCVCVCVFTSVHVCVET